MSGYEELRKLASAATRGPWEARTFMVYGGSKLRDVIVHVGTSTSLVPPRSNKTIANAAWVAACSPDVILALLDEVGRLQAALRDIREKAHQGISHGLTADATCEDIAALADAAFTTPEQSQ